MTTPPPRDALAAWLLERIAEDEQWAWIARWDPDRALAECKAKRRIIAEVVDEANDLDSVFGHRGGVEPPLGDILLRILALPYANRPGYRQEWRP